MSTTTHQPERIAELMAAVLGLDEVEVDEDFFALGGNSLDVGRLCADLAQVCGRPVPFGQVYRVPTARALAAALGANQAPAQPAPVTVPGQPVALTRGQVNLAQTGDDVVCVLAWWLTGPVDLDALRLATADVHRRHETLHCQYRTEMPPTAVLPADPGTPEFVVFPPTQEGGEDAEAEAEAVLDRVVGQPLAITEGRVWRVVVVPAPTTGRTLLGLGIHHIAFDGWSQVLLVGDLTLAYRARRAGREPGWDAPAPGLAALAAEEAESIADLDLAAQRDFWQGVLRTVKRLQLPGAARGPLTADGPKEGRRAFIPDAQLQVWDAYAVARRVTPFGYLVAVFGQLLREITGQRDIAMLVPVAARGAPALDAAIAARLDAVCLRLPPGNADPVEQAGTVLSAALANQDLPFSRAVEAMMQVRPDLHVLIGLPVFLLQDNVSSPFELDGCAATPVDSPVAREAPNGLTVEVFRDSDGATVRVTVRTDRLPVSLADDIAAGFGRLLCAGPQALASQVSSAR